MAASSPDSCYTCWTYYIVCIIAWKDVLRVFTFMGGEQFFFFRTFPRHFVVSGRERERHDSEKWQSRRGRFGSEVKFLLKCVFAFPARGDAQCGYGLGSRARDRHSTVKFLICGRKNAVCSDWLRVRLIIFRSGWALPVERRFSRNPWNVVRYPTGLCFRLLIWWFSILIAVLEHRDTV